jgi:prepilin-type processing-associated H-X9-DG protein
MIELLMVIFIIVVIVSVIVPALRSGRESAIRIQCVNNLRQLSLALQNYQTQVEVLPPGVVNPTGPVHNDPDDLHIGWVIQILPHIEQQFLAQQVDHNVSVYALENQTVRRAALKTLSCPAEASVKSPFGASTSYAACHHDVEAPIDADNRGVFFLNSALRDADITDGSSVTIFLGEKRIDGDDLGWVSGTRATLRNTGTPINATAARPGPPPAGSGPAPVVPVDDRVGGFGSPHRGGANFAFGDGSVRFLSERIHPSVFRLLGNRADGEMIGDDEY